MTLALTFLLTFTAGPAAFWVLGRQKPRRRYAWLLCGGVIALVLAAYAMSSRGVPGLQDGPYSALAVVLALWFAWIAVLALVMLAVRLRHPPQAIQRTCFALCAVATTLPWFGLVTAQMMAR